MQQVFRIALDPIPKGRGLRALLVIYALEAPGFSRGVLDPRVIFLPRLNDVFHLAIPE